ncbi:MAG: tetratricopeptide repeat protein, partial [Ktedonobacteraceae bacterium]|nr:tetratricopeptide repeat protein [Ktedonobacteraceae bacterium]
ALTNGELALSPQHPLIAIIFSRLIALYTDWLNTIDVATSSHVPAVLQEQVPHPLSLAGARILHKLAIVYMAQAEWRLAETSLQRVLPVYENAQEDAYEDLVLCLEQLAFLSTRQKKFQEAEIILQQTLKLREAMVGLEHPDVAASLVGLAGVHTAQGQFEQAEQLLRHALVIFVDALGPDDPTVAMCRSNLAAVYLRQNKPDQAARLFQRVLSMWERVPETFYSNNHTM